MFEELASRDDVQALDALTPWDDPAFQAGLAWLSLSVAAAARAIARDACTLSELAAMVPRCPRDEVGGTPWTSFRQEVAVARKTSSQAAAGEIRAAVRLTSVMPHTLHLLETGRMTVARAFPCLAHAPADPRSSQAPALFGTAPAGLRTSGVEAAPTDCRRSRPVQAVVLVPVETALGLSDEPAWLDGYGWIAAPSCRLLLPDAELRRLCTDRATGQVVDLAARDVRPPPTAIGVRDALRAMVTSATELSDTAWRPEPEHDPSAPLRSFVALRDRSCDGPTQPRRRASTCDLDHDRPHPHGPTAAWNLVSRSRRVHQLEHSGWTPVRTATGTTWTSPAGQVVHAPHHRRPAPGTDTDPTRRPARLPDPDELAAVDADVLTPVEPDDRHPLLPPRRGAPRADGVATDGTDDAPPW